MTVRRESCLAVGWLAQVPVGGQHRQPHQHRDEDQQARGGEGADGRHQHTLYHEYIIMIANAATVD